MDSKSRGTSLLSSWLVREGAPGRVRLRTLVLIRWIGILGQAGALFFVHYGLGFSLPLAPALGLVGASVLVNLAAIALWPPAMRLSDLGAVLFLGYDVVQLGLLLALTGGLENPFSLLILVPVTISATMLSLRSTVALCALVGVTISVIAVFHWPLPWEEAGFALPALYKVGLWVALVLGTLFIAAFAWRVAAEGRRMADALSATQLALAQEQRVSAVGALAAAAAHELGTPLATIAVVAKEIARDLPGASPLSEDIALLQSQVGRCRDLLAELSRRGQQDTIAPFERLPITAVVELVAEPHKREVIAVEIEGLPEETAPSSLEPVIRRSPEILHGLGNLIENAVQFANHKVVLVIRWDAAQIRLEILDDGPGFAPGVLHWLGEPYLSKRREDDRMGLGVFIAKTLLQRTGAHIGFANRRTGGARVMLSWHRASLEGGAPESALDLAPQGGGQGMG